MKKYYRWYLVNNQDMCYLSIVRLIDGYYQNEREALKSINYVNTESCYSAKPILESEISEKLYRSLK